MRPNGSSGFGCASNRGAERVTMIAEDFLEINGAGKVPQFRVPPLGGHDPVTLCRRPPKGGTLNGVYDDVLYSFGISENSSRR